jgi:hypothetical protein
VAQATCQQCGEAFQAQRSTAKYCSKRCNVRATRRRADGRPVPPTTLPAPVAAADAPEAPPAAARQQQQAADVPLLVAATIGELAANNRLGTTLGQQAVKLAERMVQSSETGAGVASLSRELRATMAEALRDAAKAGDPVDDIAERRRRKAAGA